MKIAGLEVTTVVRRMRIKLVTHLLAGLILLLMPSRSNGVGGALETMQDFRTSSPDGRSGQAYVDRGWRKEKAGDFSGAIADYSAGLAIQPKSVDVRFYRGLLYAAFGRFNEAIQDFDVALKEAPKRADIYLVRGDTHAQAVHKKEALADYDSAIRLATNSAPGDVIRARAYKEKGDYARAAAFFEQARRRSPRDDDVLNSFAWFKATCPEGAFRNGPEAIQTAMKACEITKWKDGEIIDSLAGAYAETGDFKQAIKYQIQALAIRPLAAPDLPAIMQKHLRAYQAHKGFREGPKLHQTSG